MIIKLYIKRGKQCKRINLPKCYKCTKKQWNCIEKKNFNKGKKEVKSKRLLKNLPINFALGLKHKIKFIICYFRLKKLEQNVRTKKNNISR